jgi:hypothetical protein
MVSKLPSAAVKALPITLKEFSESLSLTWNRHAQGTRRPTTLGRWDSLLCSQDVN